MKLISSITEDEMVAEFLKAEIDSPRWKAYVLSALWNGGFDRIIIDFPDLACECENKIRSNMLGYRGYKQNQVLFTGFPNKIEWQRVILAKSDIMRCKYLNSQDWQLQIGGSPYISDAAMRIRCGQLKSPLAVNILHAAGSMQDAKFRCAPILVAKNQVDDPVILEGHARLMSYLLLQSDREVEAIFGCSERISSWVFY